MKFVIIAVADSDVEDLMEELEQGPWEVYAKDVKDESQITKIVDKFWE